MKQTNKNPSCFCGIHSSGYLWLLPLQHPFLLCQHFSGFWGSHLQTLWCRGGCILVVGAGMNSRPVQSGCCNSLLTRLVNCYNCWGKVPLCQLGAGILGWWDVSLDCCWPPVSPRGDRLPENEADTEESWAERWRKREMGRTLRMLYRPTNQ